MSGDASGIIGGLVVAAVAAPFVLAAAGTAACGYGLMKAGGAVARAAKRHQEQKAIQVDQFSQEVGQIYTNLQNIASSMQERDKTYFEKKAQEMQRAAAGVLERQKHSGTQAQMEALQKESRRIVQEALGKETQKQLAAIRRQADEEMKAAIQAGQKQKAAKSALIAWKSSRASDQAMQKTFVEEGLRDAQQTLKLLRSFARKEDAKQAAQIRALETQFRTAYAAFGQGLYEAAGSSLQDLIIKGAGLMRENMLEQNEQITIRVELEAYLEGLEEETERKRCLELQDQETGGQFVEDLNDFCSGRYEKLLDQIEAQKRRVQEQGDTMSCYELLKLQEEAEALRAAGDRLYDEAIHNMQAYYQKLRIMEVIGNFMEEQGYTVRFVQPAGDDLSKKLVVNFASADTENSVSFVIDLEGEDGDIGKLVLDMMMFYGEREVTEFEKRKLREHINEELHRAGINGGLQCSGSYDQPSRQTVYSDPEQVRLLP